MDNRLKEIVDNFDSLKIGADETNAGESMVTCFI